MKLQAVHLAGDLASCLARGGLKVAESVEDMCRLGYARQASGCCCITLTSYGITFIDYDFDSCIPLALGEGIVR